MMKTRTITLQVLLLFGMLGTLAHGQTPIAIAITNPGFESPDVVQDGFTNSLGGWTNPGDAGDSFIEQITGVTPAQGDQYLGLEPGTAVHQDLAGQTYQANTIYRLSVAIGKRPGYTDPGNVARYSLTVPDGSATVSLERSATEFDDGEFRNVPPLFLNTATNPGFVGKPIRIRLSALPFAGAGTYRSHFDQIRLERGNVAQFTTVTNTNDSGIGSLREAIANAAALPGPNSIYLSGWLNGRTITLASEIAVNDASAVTIDAMNLPAGIFVSGGSSVRQFHLDGGRLALIGLTLFAGNGTGRSQDTAGGAVRTIEGTTFSASNCSFQSNSADRSGGAISNRGTAIVDRCLFFGNRTRNDNGTGDSGGAITNFGTLTVKNSTFQANSTFAGTTGGSGADSAGAIYSFGTGLSLEHCTIIGNTAGGDGTVTKAAVLVTTNATVRNCILKNNYGGPDLRGVGGAVIRRAGANLIGLSAGGTFTGPAGITGNLIVYPLANNGGRTATMALHPASAGVNRAVGSTSLYDQRLFPQKGPARDLGAFEIQTIVPILNAPGAVISAGGRATIRGTSVHAVRVQYRLAGQTLLRQTAGIPGNWSVPLVGVRPGTVVQIFATSATGYVIIRPVTVR